MADWEYVEADAFASTVESMLAGVEADISSELPAAVREACRAGRDGARREAPRQTGDYASGFTYRMGRRSRSGCMGEVGNSKKPGLVHLLEKGHAKVGGGRVAARPHLAKAFDEASDVLEERVSEAVDRALS